MLLSSDWAEIAPNCPPPCVSAVTLHFIACVCVCVCVCVFGCIWLLRDCAVFSVFGVTRVAALQAIDSGTACQIFISIININNIITLIAVYLFAFSLA